MNINIQSNIAGLCNGSTRPSAGRNIRSTRIPASIALFLCVCIMLSWLALPASAAGSAFNARIWFSVSQNGTSGWVQYQAPLDDFVWTNARPYVRIDKITFPKNPNEDSTWTGGNLFFNVHIGGVCYIEGITGFTFQNVGGNTYKGDSRGYTANPSYTLDYYVTGHNTTYPVAPSTPYYGDNFYYSRQTYVISGVVGMSANADITIEFTDPPILKFFVNGSVGEARPYFIGEFDFIPNYYDWFSTLNHNIVVMDEHIRNIVISLSSLSDMVESLDSIVSDISDLRELCDEHNAMQHEIQDQMTGAWNSYKSGASAGSDALEELDLASIAEYNPSVVDPALNNGGLLDWFTPQCHDSVRPNVTRGSGTDVLDFMDSWYQQFYDLLGGGSGG